MILAQNKDKFFCVFASCFPVKGASRSVIMDTERETYIYIPNSLYDILPMFTQHKVEDILNQYKDNADILEEYIDYLLSHEIGFFTDTPHHFPSIDTNFSHPLAILDAIIEVAPLNIEYLENVFHELSYLGCQHLELRSFNILPIPQLQYIVGLAERTRLRNIDIFIKYSDEISEHEWSKFVCDNSIVSNLIIHSSPQDEKTEIIGLQYIKQQINNSSVCGCNIKDFFTLNLTFVLESLQFNNCLHRKVSIDQDGNIVNCLNLKDNIQGNIFTHSLREVVEKKEFQKLWDINKDKVNVCKDCEYRYMCSDCRAHIDGPYEKSKYCNYDPYTNTYDDNK